MNFNLDDWPDDGTDWDGVHDQCMEKILKNQEIVEKLAKFTDEFGSLPCNAFPNWRWFQRLQEEVWGDKS